ncbi:hypothetical protein D6855_06825 [Butyrivibrio sp. CB08]|uniref:hypothetical protein n=1 Tax=Butyrivibrio sp. CB08 TaxID=2364879 RepID=UPI000EA87CBB|nr:hypothetical protein [Butyrivibrio sp. CB08]RKM60427.1 hypothetical protein D6855_06825 [Butyrivibrio sp. CB08]
MRSTFTFTQETADLRGQQWSLGDKPDDGIYVRGGAACEVTTTADEIHEVIKGEEGFFKDVTSKLTDIKKSARTKDFLFLQSDSYTFCIKLDSITEAEPGELEKIEAAAKANTKASSKPGHLIGKRATANGQTAATHTPNTISDEAKAYFRQNISAAPKRPLAERFRVNLLFAAGAIIISIFSRFDSMVFGGPSPIDPMTLVAQLILTGIGGFFMGFGYTFFATWFGNQKERTRVLSIVLFPITIPAFLLMTVIGVIPYVLFMLIKGRTTQSFYRIINVAFYVLAALVVIGEIAFASMFLI